MDLLKLQGVGKKNLQYLNKLNIFTIADLLTHFPKRYEDRRSCRSFSDIIQNPDKKFPVQVKILGYDYFFANGKKNLKIIVSDGNIRASLICFNRDFLKSSLEEGKEYIIFGDFEYKYNELQSTRFEFVPTDIACNSLNFLRIVPVYPLTEGLTQNKLRQFIYEALMNTRFDESLPTSLIKKRKLISKGESFRQIHFPDHYDILEKAVYRLKYYELFELEMSVALKRTLFNEQRKKRYIEKQYSLVSQVINTLPFKLTKGQIKAFDEIKRDLFSDLLMHRMIQGDVGCGKTVVAILAMSIALDSSFQTAFMAPTEVLARQHYNTLYKLLNHLNINIILLTGGLKSSERKNKLNQIKNGDANIVIGTHALYSEDVEYHNLSMIIIDEQHKFGVEERIKFIDKGNTPDILVMTATPIPRTLSLTVYGDLDFTIIPDKPHQNVQIKTHCIFNNNKRIEMYKYIDKEISKGRQGYVVCPLIDDSEKIDVSSVTALYEEIKKNLLPERNICLLHGRLSSDEKESIMIAYSQGEFDILIATSVIEVGIDVPNAVFMVVENADRFGLSQLHQLRGRIGRGIYDSHCFFVVPNNLTEDGKSRIKALLTHNNGYKLAEEDLKIRGPGEFLGTKQSGIDNLKLANLIEDEDILLQAKDDAFHILKNDPKLERQDNIIFNKTIYKRFLEKYQQFLLN